MPEPVIVPPAPVVPQGGDVMNLVQAAFDKAAPKIKGTPSEPPKPPQSKEASPAAVQPPAEPPKKEETPPAQPPENKSEKSHELPSFIEDVLKGEPAKAQAPADEEWPEEQPTFKTGEESKERYKKWRSSYQKLKDEVAQLRSRPSGPDEATTARMQQLEKIANDQAAILTRMGVEQHTEFQNNILRPLHGAWNDACRVVKDAGGNPADLAKAMSLSGKPQFEALDALMEGMPETAKAEIHDSLRQYKKLDQVRQKALAEAPKTFEALRKKDQEREYQVLTQQREELGNLFDATVAKLRDESKAELLMTSDNPEAKEWNEQARNIIKQARNLYLDNADMGKMAVATILAPMADVYRKLWLKERIAHATTKKTLNGKFESEPNLSESGGGLINSTPSEKQKADLKRPFADVFMEELNRQTKG